MLTKGHKDYPSVYEKCKKIVRGDPNTGLMSRRETARPPLQIGETWGVDRHTQKVNYDPMGLDERNWKQVRVLTNAEACGRIDFIARQRMSRDEYCPQNGRDLAKRLYFSNLIDPVPKPNNVSYC